jgi:hypothetical protein
LRSQSVAEERPPTQTQRISAAKLTGDKQLATTASNAPTNQPQSAAGLNKEIANQLFHGDSFDIKLSRTVECALLLSQAGCGASFPKDTGSTALTISTSNQTIAFDGMQQYTATAT